MFQRQRQRLEHAVRLGVRWLVGPAAPVRVAAQSASVSNTTTAAVPPAQELQAPTPPMPACPTPAPVAPAPVAPAPAAAVAMPVSLFGGPLLSPDKPLDKSQNAARLELIRQEVATCQKCRLCDRRRSTVFGEGNPTARLMFIGEGPGADEDITGRPFVGKAGQLLDKMIAAMRLSREEVYIANVVKCRPPENRVPNPDEIFACEPYLLRQIEIVRPEVICALGATAAKTLLQTRDSLSSMRGRWYDWRGLRLMVTFHPAYLLRQPGDKAKAWQDLQMVMAQLGIPLR